MRHKASARVPVRRGALAALFFAFALLPSFAAAQEQEADYQTIYESDRLVVSASADKIITGTGAGFVTIFASSVIRDNVVTVFDSVNTTRLENSLMGNQGIMQVNQDSGIGANQANIVAISVAAGAGTVPVGVAILSDAHYSNNTIFASNVTRTNVIENILDGSAGIAQISQNSGNLNRNLNALGIAVGFGKGDAVVITEGNLAAASSGATFNYEGTIQSSSRIDGVRNFSGIGQIAQTAGDGNVAANSLAIGVVVINR
jgi:hypothetical protein